MASTVSDNRNWIRTFQVTQPVRHKKGFTVYKIVSKMFQRTFPEGATTITVWKRYTDFRKLFAELQLIHSQLHLKGDFPKFPKAKVFGRFDYEVVEERRKSALALLEFAARHSLLFTSKVFIKFFESGYNIEDLNSATVSEESSQSESDYETCLVPEKLWSEPLPLLPEVKGNAEEDAMSGASIDSSAISITTPPATSANMDDLDSLALPTNTVLNSRSSSELSADGGWVFVASRSSSNKLPETGNQVSSSPNHHMSKPNGDVVATSVTAAEEETDSVLSLLPDEGQVAQAQTHRSTISGSMSCSSLSSLEIPTAATARKSESFVDLQESRIRSIGQKSGQKKPNGFGFFDFLPVFSKKRNEQGSGETVGKLLSDSLTASYICEAAGHFALAQQHESSRDFSRAFRSYKEGIRILLLGAKDDQDVKRKRLVKNKLDRYLLRAEFIHENHLSLSPNPKTEPSAERNEPGSPISFNSEHIWQSALTREAKNLKASENRKSSPLCELNEYKLVRVISRQVYLVVNIKRNTKPKCYAIKVLLKSSSPLYSDKPTLIPENIPFMVNLFQWFETENSYILVMQYAGGGRLTNFVESYQTKSVAIPVLDQPINEYGEQTTNEEQSELTHDMLTVLDAFADLGSDNENCDSYSRLFEEYSESYQNDSTQLATFSKCLKRTISSDSHVEIENSEKEICEVPSNTFVSFDELQSKNFVDSTKDSQVEWTSSLSTSSFEERSRESETDVKNFDLLGTQKLIDSSRVLLCTVNQTLANTGCNGAGVGDAEAARLPIPLSQLNPSENNQPDQMPPPHIPLQQKNVGLNHIESRQPEKSNKWTQSGKNKSGSQYRQPCKSSPDILEEEEDEGIQSSCESSDIPRSNSNEFSTKALGGLATNSGEEQFLAEDNGRETVCLEATELEFQDLIPKRMVPECCIKIWAAEIVLALERLHASGIAFGDLETKNVLLGEDGHILLTLPSQLSEVDQSPEFLCRRNKFLAPEICNSLGLPKWKIHPSSDFWSLGVILFELVTGQTLESAHPEGFLHPDAILKVPEENIMGDPISHNCRTLLAELLQYTLSLRLGFYGAAEVKSHPFFEGFDWESALEAESFMKGNA